MDLLKWRLLNPARGDTSPKAADLWGDRTQNIPTGMLVNFAKGFASPHHIHNISYRAIIIEGEEQSEWMQTEKAKIAYLWGEPGKSNGSFIKLSAGFKGEIKSKVGLKAVLIKGEAAYHKNKTQSEKLTPGSFFSSEAKAKHQISTQFETIFYINSKGAFWVDS